MSSTMVNAAADMRVAKRGLELDLANAVKAFEYNTGLKVKEARITEDEHVTMGEVVRWHRIRIEVDL